MTIRKPYTADPGPWYVGWVCLTLSTTSQVPTFCSSLDFVFVSGTREENDSLGPCYLSRFHFSLAFWVSFVLGCHSWTVFRFPFVLMRIFLWIIFSDLRVQYTCMSKFFLLSFGNRLWGRVLALDVMLPLSSVHLWLHSTIFEQWVLITSPSLNSISPVFCTGELFYNQQHESSFVKYIHFFCIYYFIYYSIS